MLGKPCYSQYEIYPISGYFSKLGAHQTMLADEKRTEAFYNALKESIIPGKSVVMDIGTGTGILAMMAAKLGAKRVFAIETSPIVNLAREISRDNGFAKKIKFIKGYSSDLKLNIKADVIVSETIGFTGLEENIVDIMLDACRRFSHKDTILIPSNISVHCALTSDTTINDLMEFWKKPINNFSYKKVTRLTKNNLYGRLLISRKTLLSVPETMFNYKLGNDSLFKKQTIVFKAKYDGLLSGFVVWFSAKLSNSKKIDSYSYGNHWQQVFIPINNPVKIKTNEIVKLELSVNKVKKCVSYNWTYKICNNKKLITGKGSTADIIKYCTN